MRGGKVDGKVLETHAGCQITTLNTGVLLEEERLVVSGYAEGFLISSVMITGWIFFRTSMCTCLAEFGQWLD
jgi:hypothetical protein